MSVPAPAAGDAVIDPSITRGSLGPLRRSGSTAATLPSRLDVLDPREVDVCGSFCRGLTNSEIAAELVVGKTTIKTHIGRILAKFEPARSACKR